MPPANEIQQYLTGAWRMMLGRPHGIELLDISADGFWNSFYAVVVALPPMLLGWAVLAQELHVADEAMGGRIVLVARLGITDIATWLLPIAGLAAVARPAGIGARFVHYVVASNWGSAITAWLMLPATMVRLIAPEVQALSDLVALALFGVILLLGWRLTNAALARGPGPATALFAGMLGASFAVLFLLQEVLGLAPPVSA